MSKIDLSLFQEVITSEELDSLDLSKSTAYIGFEPSGTAHIGTGLMWTDRINNLISAGVTVKVLMADWHAMINDKLGGDLERIRVSGRLMVKTFKALGMDPKVQIIWASDMVGSPDYWMEMLKVAKSSSLSRLRRALPIMGRSEDDADKDFGKYIYPLMQVTDIFRLDVDICMGGMDQRHAHMLARDIAEKIGTKKAISLHGPLIGSLKGTGRMDSENFKKMSKSDPDSGILVSDAPEEIKRKISQAFCPIGETKGNPIIEIAKFAILPRTHNLEIKRPEKKGGPIYINSAEELESLYSQGNIHPMDLKASVTDYLIKILEPARDIYKGNP